MNFLRALIVLHRTYGRLPPGPRIHVLVRFLTCPFLRTLRALPPGTSSLLEIGAGHGVFSRLARASGVTKVVAVEPDVRKIVQVDGVRSVIGYDEAIRGSFDAVALVDVLYTIPLHDWDRLLSSAVARLTPGGTLLVKEQDPTARVRNGWNRLQEWFAQDVLRVTMAKAFAYEPPSVFADRLARHGLSVTWKRIDLGYPHAHVLYVGRRGRTEHGARNTEHGATLNTEH